MNKEYRPIRHVYSLGHKLPTGGLGDGPYEIKYSVTAGFCKYLLIISLESHMTFSNTKYELQNDRGNLRTSVRLISSPMVLSCFFIRRAAR